MLKKHQNVNPRIKLGLEEILKEFKSIINKKISKNKYDTNDSFFEELTNHFLDLNLDI